MITVIRITVEDAKKLPNMMGKIVPAMLLDKGSYTCVCNGEKVKFIRIPTY